MPKSAKSYIIRSATDKELERIKEFQDGCPDFGFHNLSDEWTANTLAERSKVLLEYIDEFADTKFYEDIAYTKGWNDYTDLSITTITRRAQPLVEYVLSDPAWLGTDGSDSDCWAGLDAGKDFKFLYVGLIRLLCSVRGIQDKAHIADWFTDYDPTQTGFFGINGCDGDNKCHTVPNPVGRRQPDGHRVAPVVQAKKAVEITPVSIYKYIAEGMTEPEGEALVRKLMSEFGIKEQVDTNEEQKEVFTCPEGYDECDLPDGRTIWENEDTGDIVFPCADVSKAKLFIYSNEDFTEIKPKEETEKTEYPDIDYECLFELRGYNVMRGETDADYKNCWKAVLSKQVKTYKEWQDLEL